MYRLLEVDRILETAQRLERRIESRFPQSGLLRVAREMIEIVRDGRDRLSRLGRPRWNIRLGASAAIVVMAIGLIGMPIVALRTHHEIGNWADLIQAFQALLDEIVLGGIAVLFLIGLETRAKRSDALAALHQYRSLAHVIDMHQLTKDPEYLIFGRSARTDASPQRDLNRFKLGRYLDYCSEMLSLVSKMAALHVQDFPDPVLLNAVRDVESLTGSLQAKIWQKKLILDVTKPTRRRSFADRLSSMSASGRSARTARSDPGGAPDSGAVRDQAARRPAALERAPSDSHDGEAAPL